jgi:hypothetical protein
MDKELGKVEEEEEVEEEVFTERGEEVRVEDETELEEDRDGE